MNGPGAGTWVVLAPKGVAYITIDPGAWEALRQALLARDQTEAHQRAQITAATRAQPRQPRRMATQIRLDDADRERPIATVTVGAALGAAL